MVDLWSNFVLLLTYGVLSPYAAVAIGVSIFVKAYKLRWSICRYTNLQFKNGDLIESVQRSDPLHIETLCENCHCHFRSMIWPGLVMSSVLFGFYVFEVALDRDDDDDEGDGGSIALPVVLMLFVLATTPIAKYLFDRNHSKLQDNLKANTVGEDPEVCEMTAIGMSSDNGRGVVVRNPIPIMATATTTVNVNGAVKK